MSVVKGVSVGRYKHYLSFPCVYFYDFSLFPLNFHFFSSWQQNGGPPLHIGDEHSPHFTHALCDPIIHYAPWLQPTSPYTCQVDCGLRQNKVLRRRLSIHLLDGTVVQDKKVHQTCSYRPFALYAVFYIEAIYCSFPSRLSCVVCQGEPRPGVRRLLLYTPGTGWAQERADQCGAACILAPSLPMR